MASLRAILSHHQTFFRTQNPQFIKALSLLNPLLESDLVSTIFPPRLNLSPISLRPFSSSADSKQIITSELKTSGNGDIEKKNATKPLDIFFKEAVGIMEKSENVEEYLECENGELKKRLKKLEDEVRSIKEQRKIERLKLKEKSENGEEEENEEDSIIEPKQSLFELFAGNDEKDGKNLRKVNKLRMEDSGVHKELSSDMIMFVSHLYKEGYFEDSNFLPRNKFAIGCFENSYARDFVKFAAEQFGKDNQEIAKWLSASDLKKVALFGCPSIARKTVFSAKRLRTFFRIQENTVCDRCVLKKSCGFVNQTVWKGDTKSLNLAVIMRVITLYALESVPSELVVTDEIKSSVGKLLKEAVNLSGTVPKIS